MLKFELVTTYWTTVNSTARNLNFIVKTCTDVNIVFHTFSARRRWNGSDAHLSLHTNRRSRSRGWSAPPRRRWRSCRRIPRSKTSISSWRGRGLGRVPGRTGSGWWWSRPRRFCWSWRAEGEWPQTPGRWRTSTGSAARRRKDDTSAWNFNLNAHLCWKIWV